jgi:hypothetical protein
MSRAIRLILLCAFMTWTGRNLPLPLPFMNRLGRTWPVCYAPISFAMSVGLSDFSHVKPRQLLKRFS